MHALDIPLRAGQHFGWLRLRIPTHSHKAQSLVSFTRELDPYRLSDIAHDLMQRYARLHRLDDLKNAIVLYRRALQLVPNDHTNKPCWLNNLGCCLRRLFFRSGEMKSIESAISAHREAIDLILDGHFELPVLLCNLAVALLARFDRFGDPNDLEDALEADRCAVALTLEDGSKLPRRLSNFANSLRTRFKRFGESEDLESALEADRRAVALTPDDDPGHPRRLSNLAVSLWTRFDRFGVPGDLESALETILHAVALTPDGDPELALRLSNLASFLRTRFDRFGEPDDLEDAFEADRRAVALMPDDEPKLPQLLSNFALSFKARFNRFGEPGDLKSALETDRHAVALTPDNDPELPRRMSNLAITLKARFDCFGEPDDLESALESDRRAVALTADGDPYLPLRLSNLAISFKARFDHFGEPSDLESALKTILRAVTLTPDGDPELPPRLNNLASSLRTCFNLFGKAHDLEGAIEADRRAVKLTPESHPDMSESMIKLGHSLECRFARDRTQTNFDEVSRCYLAAVALPLGYPSLRFQSAQRYVQILTDYPEFRDLDSLLLGHSYIMKVIYEIVWLGHSVRRRFDECARVGKLVNDAVSVSIESNDLPRAVGWLEAGRTVIWSQVASMRTPLDDLAIQLPGSALELQNIQLELQQFGLVAQMNDAPNCDMIAHDAHDGRVRREVYAETAADRYRRAAIRYDSLLKDIRSWNGFKSFMQPKRLVDFIASPAFTRLNGYVVFINVAKSSCDALILLPNGTVKVVRLPNLSQAHAEKKRNLWTETIDLRRANRRGVTPWEFGLVRGCSNTHTLVLGRLWTWVVHPVLEALDFIKEYAGKPLPHVFWCPTGPVTQLPLHAAGIYGREQPSCRISNFVISSYTPSLSALLRCLERNDEQRASPRMLLVAQTNTPRPGLIALPHVRDESARIRALFHGDEHTFLEDEQAKVEPVLAAINQHTWVHFACHGSQNPTDPTLTSVELYDKPLTLTDLMRTVSDDAELAFLSACETAVGNKKIPEESAHLAAGMLAVGFKGVVATMWSIHDEDGPVIVEAYYKKLLELRATGAVPRGHTGAAYALHHAGEVLRNEVGEKNFERWVPFVHFGV